MKNVPLGILSIQCKIRCDQPTDDRNRHAGHPCFRAMKFWLNFQEIFQHKHWDT